jgi:DNA-binding transcriptional LysR family regulator
MRGNLSGTLRVGAIPTALTVAPMLTAPFCQRHPHTRISLEFLSSREIARRLINFEIDLAMTYVDDDELDNVRTTPLYEERYLLVVPNESACRDPTVVDHHRACLAAHVPTLDGMRIVPLERPARTPKIGT